MQINSHSNITIANGSVKKSEIHSFNDSNRSSAKPETSKKSSRLHLSRCLQTNTINNDLSIRDDKQMKSYKLHKIEDNEQSSAAMSPSKSQQSIILNKKLFQRRIRPNTCENRNRAKQKNAEFSLQDPKWTDILSSNAKKMFKKHSKTYSSKPRIKSASRETKPTKPMSLHFTYQPQNMIERLARISHISIDEFSKLSNKKRRNFCAMPIID